MARDENWTPSRRLQTAAAAEVELLTRRMTELDDEVLTLQERLARVLASRDELRDRQEMLNRLMHGAGAPAVGTAHRHEPARHDDTTEPDNGELLRGQAIREAAVRVLVESSRAHEPLHYRDWFELLRSAGMLPAGKDPLATFLTQLGRSPVIAKSTSQGVYMLDHEFITRAQQRLARLTRELRDTQLAPVTSDPQAMARTRQRRAEVTAEIERTELELEEALRSLGAPAEPRLAAASGR